MTVTVVRGLPAASRAMVPAGIVTDAFPSAEYAVMVEVTVPVWSVVIVVAPSGVTASGAPPIFAEATPPPSAFSVNSNASLDERKYALFSE